MKDFLKQLLLFLLIPAFLLIGALFLPVTERAKTSMLFEQLKKDSLLRHAPSPRLVMIGGSNLSMSLNSQTLQDSLGLYPVNMGLHAAMGLVFQLDHVLPHIKKGDVVLVVPEYAQFYGDFGYGDKELLLTVADVRAAAWSDLNWKQIKNILPFVPKYAFTKFNGSEYKKPKGKILNLKQAFNDYGDWAQRFDSVHNTATYEKEQGRFNESVLQHLKDFEAAVEQKGAQMLVSFPALQQQSFDNSVESIQAVGKAYRDNGFRVIGNPGQYRLPNELMYDTPYHLNDQGVKLRTAMLVSDLKADLK